MADYINRNSAIEGIEDEVIRIAKMLPDSENTRNLIKGAKDSIDTLRHMPSVDAVEVVRCQDCRYHYDNGSHICRKLSIVLPDDSEFFCQYGKE